MKNHSLIKLALAIVTLVIVSGCNSRSGPPASVHYDRTVSPYHVVKKGDSIASISRKYGMDKRELIRTNGIESPYRIVKGQRLIVRPRPTSKHSRHEVEEMEAPATEEVSSVPEEDDVQVKPLAPAPGLMGESTLRGGIPSEGRANPEIDDEAEGEALNDTQEDGNKSKYDEEKIDEFEKSKRPMLDNSFAAPVSSGGYTWPVKGNVTRPYNPKGKGNAQNDGINISAAKNSPVVAASDGVVARATNHLRGFGNVVLIKHPNGTMTVYAHLNKVTAKQGQSVQAGQQIGTVGQTGTATSPQLHFEIREKLKPIDPNRYLS